MTTLFTRTIPARQVAVLRMGLALAAFGKSLDLPWRIFESGVQMGIWPLWQATWSIAALMLLLGLLPRIAGITLFVVFWQFSTQVHYANHFAFIAIAGLLLALVDSGAQWSVRSSGINELPAWPLVLIKIHLCVVYFFAGVAKINPAWISGAYLRSRTEVAMLWPSMETPMFVFVVFGVATILWELTAPFGLWWRRTMPIYLAIGVAAHLGMIVILSDTLLRVHSLSVFAIAVFAVYVLFLPSTWFDGSSAIDRFVARVPQSYTYTAHRASL